MRQLVPLQLGDLPRLVLHDTLPPPPLLLQLMEAAPAPASASAAFGTPTKDAASAPGRRLVRFIFLRRRVGGSSWTGASPRRGGRGPARWCCLPRRRAWVPWVITPGRPGSWTIHKRGSQEMEEEGEEEKEEEEAEEERRRGMARLGEIMEMTEMGAW